MHCLILELLILWVLEAKIRLYPPVQVIGKSFVGVKRQTVPNQSLSLREIVKRFVRRESLPISKDGVYESRFGDLEKLTHADITTKIERIEELKAQIKAFHDREKQRADSLAKAKAEASAVPSSPPIVPGDGVSPIKSPPIGA